MQYFKKPINSPNRFLFQICVNLRAHHSSRSCQRDRTTHHHQRLRVFPLVVGLTNMWISRTDEMLVSSVKHRCCYDDGGGYRLLPSSPLYLDITESSWHVIVYLIRAVMSPEAASWLRVCVTVYMRYHMVCRTCVYTCISFHYQEHFGSAVKLISVCLNHC